MSAVVRDSVRHMLHVLHAEVILLALGLLVVFGLRAA
jgi:hypothetical protein